MKLNTIDDIEQMARECIDGSIDAKHVWGLPIFDMWAVLTLGALYSCTKLGMIGAKDCAKMKYVVLNRYEMFKTRTVFFEKMYENWIDRTKRFSGTLARHTFSTSSNSFPPSRYLSGMVWLVV